MDFDNAVYGDTFDRLENAIHGASLRQKQIAQNIANIESDNFSQISFKDTLDKAKMKKASKEALIDDQMSKMAENNLKITSYAQLMSSKLKILRKVVTLGKG